MSLFKRKAEEVAKDDDANELIDLDVRHVSGVGEPATGIRFLLMKSTEPEPQGEGKHYPWGQCVADQTADGKSEESARKICATIGRRSSLPNKIKAREAASKGLPPLTEFMGKDIQLPADADLQALTEEAVMEVENTELRGIGERIANAFGVVPADGALAEALDLIKGYLARAEKASGKAPKDDAGKGEPRYNNSPTHNFSGQAPTDDKSAPKLGKAGVDGSTATQQVQTQGTPAADASTESIVQGAPAPSTGPAALYKSMSEVLANAEKHAANREAFQAAREAMEAAFAQPPAPQEEAHMTENEVSEMLLKGLDPIIEVVERLESTITDLTAKVEALETRTTNADAARPVAKSRVPAVTEPARKGQDVWSDSPFAVAAGYQ